MRSLHRAEKRRVWLRAWAVGSFVLGAGLLYSQQPGSSSDVRTGTTSGLDADARIQNLLATHEFFRIQALLDTLPREDAELYRGILANRNNDLKGSIQILEPLLDRVVASGNKAHEKLLRKALAEDYLRTGDWAKASAAYQTLDTRLHMQLSADEKDEIELPLKLLPMAAANPPMTVDSFEPFTLQLSKNPLGLFDLPVFVDARPHSWMLDPTAPFNLISRSLAREVGLRVSDQATVIHTLTGRKMEVHATVIPRFTLGGHITFHNMTAFVFEDRDYYFPKTRHQVQGVLGYPALSTVGTMTITDEDNFEVQPRTGKRLPALNSRPPQGTRFFFDGDQMIVALGKPGDERMAAIDEGGQQTYMTSRYYEEHSREFANKKMELFSIPGADTRPPEPAYMAESIPLVVGTNTVQLHYLQVLTQPLGSAVLDDVYGILGIDALDQLRAYTFDFENMRFSIKPE